MPIGMVRNDSKEGRKRPSADSEFGAKTVQQNASDGKDNITTHNRNLHSTKNSGKQVKKKIHPTAEVDATEDLYDNSISEDYDVEEDAAAGRNKVIVVAVVAIVVVLALILAKIFIIDSDKRDSSLPTTDEESVGNDSIVEEDHNIYDEDGNIIYNEDGEVVNKDAINPGLTTYDTEQSQTTATVYSASDFIKDLNGVDVSAVYNVASRDYVFDYVNYEAKRAIMDDGMELYWLDVKYNDKDYRIQVPFLRFKDLKASGICKVQVEVLTLEGGGKIISWMQVVDDSAGVE